MITPTNKQELQQQKRDEWKAIIRRIMLFNPKCSILQIQRILKGGNESLYLSYPTLLHLVKEIKEENIKHTSLQVRDEIAATFQELVEFVNRELWKVAQESSFSALESSRRGEEEVDAGILILAQNNRIRALQGIVENYFKLTKLKLELGVLDRRSDQGDIYRFLNLFEMMLIMFSAFN